MKALREKGYYEPLMGGPQTQKDMQKEGIKSQEKISKEKTKEAAKAPPAAGPNGQPPAPKNSAAPGRPPGAGQGEKQQSPRESQRIGIKTKANYDFSKVKGYMIQAQKLENEIGAYLRKQHKIKRLSKAQKQIADEISDIIIANENPEDWTKNIEKYCKKPEDSNKERALEITKIAAEHHVDTYLASLLYISKV
jgi:hypothetical protein